MPELMFSFLFQFHTFSPPPAAQWSVLTDGTERGGASHANLKDGTRGVVFSGEVGAIQGREGLVGFAIARTPQNIEAVYGGVAVHLNSETKIVVSVVAESSQLNEGPEGKPVYQARVELDGVENTHELRWTDFKPFVRGRPLPEEPKLEPQFIESLGIQINRSAQPEVVRNDPSPIPFSIEILKN